MPAERQSRRYWVDRSLQDAKGLVGLNQYRVTGWCGWHHHTAMVMLAMFYLSTTKATHIDRTDSLTLKDTLAIIRINAPQRQLTYENAEEIIREKLKKSKRTRLIRLKA